MAGSILLLVLFLVTLAFHLLVVQRAPTLPGGGGVQTATDLLLKVLGGLFVLLLVYAVFSRVTRRGQPSIRALCLPSAMPAA